MNQSKFSLADLLTVLGAVGFGFFCFLSLNFLSLGKTMPSISWAVVLALLLGGLAFVAKLLKKTSRNFKTCIIWEWILLLLFAGIALVAVVPFSHYFAVLEQRTQIQGKAIGNIDQATKMFAEYENYASTRESIYKSHLNSAVYAHNQNVNDSEYRKYGFVDGTSDSVQVNIKMFTIHTKLFPSNYGGEDGTKLVATNWLAEAKNILDSKWAFTFGIVDVVNNVQTNITAWKGQLIQFSAFRAKGEDYNDFDNPLSFNNVTGKITELGSPTLLSIVYAMGLYALMLLSYFVSKRHTRYPGLKVIFGTSGVKENEL